jgi:hypothetical protein
MTSLLRLLLVVALVLPIATAARAQAPAGDGVETKDNATQAKEHFAAGTRAYNLGEFALALSEYKTAYKLNPLPAFLFNIGQCHYALGEYERAIFFYEGFLRESPASEHRTRVEGFIAEARRRQDEKAASAPTTTTTATTPATTSSSTTSAATPVEPTAGPAPVEEAGITDAAWFWPSVAGAAVVVAAATTAIVFVVARPQGTLEHIDATKGSP